MVGVRVPGGAGGEFCRAVAAATADKAFLLSSANPAGGTAARTAAEIERMELAQGLAAVYDSGPTEGALGSTVVLLSRFPAFTVLRAGDAEAETVGAMVAMGWEQQERE